jgi:PAS domain S-box-containing protein
MAKTEGAHQTEDPSHLFIESVVDYAIFMLDPRGYITTWNAGAERLKGYKASEIIGQHFSVFYPPSDVQHGKPQHLLNQAVLHGRVEDEGWRVRKDGSRFWADVVLTAVRDSHGNLVGYGKVTRDLTERNTAEEALRRSEERARLFADAVQDYAIFMLDSTGNIATWNRGAQRIKGYQAPEIIGKHFSIFYPEVDLIAGKPARELEVAAREGRFEDEGWRLRKDGSQFWANVIITAVRNQEGELLGFSKVTRDFTEPMLSRKALEESQAKLQASERSLRELSLHLLRTQDEERRLIGREMHDSLGQYLSVLKMRLDSMSASEDAAKRATREGLVECARLADDCAKEVRTVSYLLYPPMLEEMGLKHAIPWYLEGFSQRSGIATKFEVDPQLERLPRDAELVLFRVLQESLTNVHKHSGSKTADVFLRCEEGSVVLEIVDTGAGFSHALGEGASRDWMGSLGVGLRGMSERLRQLGGRLDVNSSGAGTRVLASVPVQDSTEQKQANA